MQLTAIEHWLLYALSLDSGCAITYAPLMRRVWNESGIANLPAMRSAI